jgi:hypothetical protein
MDLHKFNIIYSVVFSLFVIIKSKYSNIPKFFFIFISIITIFQTSFSFFTFESNYPMVYTYFQLCWFFSFSNTFIRDKFSKLAIFRFFITMPGYYYI